MFYSAKEPLVDIFGTPLAPDVDDDDGYSSVQYGLEDAYGSGVYTLSAGVVQEQVLDGNTKYWFQTTVDTYARIMGPGATSVVADYSNAFRLISDSDYFFTTTTHRRIISFVAASSGTFRIIKMSGKGGEKILHRHATEIDKY
jgi:hypothetical protein